MCQRKGKSLDYKGIDFTVSKKRYHKAEPKNIIVSNLFIKKSFEITWNYGQGMKINLIIFTLKNLIDLCMIKQTTKTKRK